MKCVEERKTTNFCEKHFLKKLLEDFFLGGSKVSKSLNLFLGFFVHKVFVPPSSTSSTQKILSEKMYRLGGEGGHGHFFLVKCVEERKTVNFVKSD